MPESYSKKIDDQTKELLDKIRVDMSKIIGKLEAADIDYVIAYGPNISQRSSHAFLFSRMWILFGELLKQRVWDEKSQGIFSILLEGLAALLNRRPILAIEIIERHYRAIDIENDENKIVENLLRSVEEPKKDDTGTAPNNPVV